MGILSSERAMQAFISTDIILISSANHESTNTKTTTTFRKGFVKITITYTVIKFSLFESLLLLLVICRYIIQFIHFIIKLHSLGNINHFPLFLTCCIISGRSWIRPAISLFKFIIIIVGFGGVCLLMHFYVISRGRNIKRLNWGLICIKEIHCICITCKFCNRNHLFLIPTFIIFIMRLILLMSSMHLLGLPILILIYNVDVLLPFIGTITRTMTWLIFYFDFVINHFVFVGIFILLPVLIWAMRRTVFFLFDTHKSSNTSPINRLSRRYLVFSIHFWLQ